MPTFKFFKDGKEVDMVRGANESKLREKMMHFQAGTWDPSMATMTKKDEGMTPGQMLIGFMVVLFLFLKFY